MYSKYKVSEPMCKKLNDCGISGTVGLWQYCVENDTDSDNLIKKCWTMTDTDDYSGPVTLNGVDYNVTADEEFDDKNVFAAFFFIFNAMLTALYLLFEIGGCLDLEALSVKIGYSTVCILSFAMAVIGTILMTGCYCPLHDDINDGDGDFNESLHIVGSILQTAVADANRVKHEKKDFLDALLDGYMYLEASYDFPFYTACIATGLSFFTAAILIVALFWPKRASTDLTTTATEDDSFLTRLPLRPLSETRPRSENNVLYRPRSERNTETYWNRRQTRPQSEPNLD